MSDTRVAVVGAGLAGAATAYGLRAADATVTVFEASDRLGGRAETRVYRDCRYDPGANYVKAADERVNEVVKAVGGAVDVAEPVWTFDREGTVEPGDDRDEAKWTWRAGVADFARRLLDASDAALRKSTSVRRLRRADDGWRLRIGAESDSGSNHGATDRFDAVVLTPPAPVTARLLDASGEPELAEAAGRAAYRSIVTAVLHYPFELDRPYYALVNTDREHAVGWVSREACKPDRVPAGESLLIVQMAPDWSATHFDADESELTAMAAKHVAALLDDRRLDEPDWSDVARYRDALPDTAADRETLDAAADRGLYVAGDWVVGEGRTHAAVRTGLAVADRIG